MRGDGAAGLVILAGAAFLYLFGGLPSLGAIWRDPNAAFWPYLLLGALTSLGSILAAQGFLRSALADGGAARASPSAGPAVAWNVAVIVAYVVVLFVFGFYVAAFAFALAGPPILGGVKWRSAALFAIAFTAAVWVVFTLLLRMDLPAGYLTLSQHEAVTAAANLRHG
jgi:hypothetical protein